MNVIKKLFRVKKEKGVDYTQFGFGCLPSEPDENDEYIHFLDNGGYQIYKIKDGNKVIIRTESAPFHRQVV